MIKKLYPCIALLMFTICTCCLGQNQAESVYKNYQTYTFPDYFEIRYPKDWIVTKDMSIAFSCKREQNGQPLALATGRVIKQISFSDYLKNVLEMHFTRSSPLIFSTTVNGKRAVYFNTPVYGDT